MKILFHNGKILTQARGVVADSIVLKGNRIIAVGRKLQYDPELKSFPPFDLRGKTVIPGLVDAHTHFYMVALAQGRLSLEGLTSIAACQKKIKKFADKLDSGEWLFGFGYSADLFAGRIEPDRIQLDAVTPGIPVFIYSKDHHSAWVNSRALELAGITKKTPDPAGGRIERDADGNPNGILRENPAIEFVRKRIPNPAGRKLDKLFEQALSDVYSKGVTGVHSFDDAEAFSYYAMKAEKGKLGLRINYYPRDYLLEGLLRSGTRYGDGDEFLRIAGIKIFSDGALGSRTALCFNRYLDGTKQRGIEVTSTSKMKSILKNAVTAGLPCAIHAIGDKAVSNVLDAIEKSPPLKNGARHRIEHLQLMRRKDIPRLKRLSVIASMQPSHCTSDIDMVHTAWGKRGANAYIFRTVLDNKIDLAFGSDAPIGPLNPLADIAAAVRRARKGSRNIFYPEQRVSVAEALHAFTAGSAIAAGQADCRGYLLPGYPADIVILRDDIARVAASRIYDTPVLATILDGQVKFAHSSMKL